MKNFLQIPLIKLWPHYSKILGSKNYTKWKLNSLNNQRNWFQQGQVFCGGIYIIISLILRITCKTNLFDIIWLVCFIIVELILIWVYNVYQKIQTYYLLQYIFTTLYILVYGRQNELSSIFIVFYFTILGCQSNIIVRLLLYIYLICIISLLYQYEFFEIIIIGLICFMYNCQLESNFVKNYIKQLKLMVIIEQMPQAICIINQNTKQITYSNQLFDKLAQTLCLTDETSQSLNFTNKEIQQLDFINNLNLEEIKNDGFQISDLVPQLNDEGVTDDQFKIVNVDFKRQTSQNTIQNLSFATPSPVKLQKKKKDVFSYINTNDYELATQKKSFITTINLHLQISHQPKSYVLSAQTKRRKKSSNNINPNKLPSVRNSYSRIHDLQSSYYENLKLSPNHQDTINHHLIEQEQQHKYNNDMEGQKASTIHKVRLMVSQTQITDQLIDDTDYQIYCINELSPLILQYTVKKLEQAKKNIMRSLSHELRTSLNAVNGYICEAYEKIENIVQLDKNLKLSLNYIELMQLKLQDCFDYRDILEDQFVLKTEKINLKYTLQHAIDLIRDQCYQKKLNLHVEFPKEKIIVIGDQQRLLQVLVNLLQNGIKFTNQGGITVKVAFNTPANMLQGFEELRSFDTQTQLVEIRIIDSGKGMKDEQKGNLNKKLLFVDEDQKISKDSVGIGIGLSVCKSIIKGMGPKLVNSLFLESIQGVGSQFYFFLNCDSVYEEQAESEKPEQESASLKSPIRYNPPKCNFIKQNCGIQIKNYCSCKQLLLVDDEQFNLDILKKIIENLVRKEHTIIKNCFNGQQVLEMIKQSKCSLCVGFKAILMDIQMPIMNGWECVKQIRQYEIEHNLKKRTIIIAITGFGGQKDQEKSLNMGFDFVLTKPTNKEQIKALFQKFNI